MDLQVLITAGVGIVTTFCSGFFAFLFSKKKYNAEVDSKQIANIKSTLDIYQNMVKDLDAYTLEKDILTIRMSEQDFYRWYYERHEATISASSSSSIENKNG